MFRSLKTKLILAFGSLMVVLFVVVGAFLVDSKAKELSQDIAGSSQSFAQFTVEPVMEAYEQYLVPGNFIPFSREMSAVLRQNTDVSSLSIASYSGELLYESELEALEVYNGDLRSVSEDMILRVQAVYPSVLLEDGRRIFLKTDADGNVEYVDANEGEVQALMPKDRIVNIVVPYNSSYAVTYAISYDALEARLRAAQMQIAGIALVGLFLTLLIAFMMSVSITSPLKRLKAGALQIAQGDFSTRVQVKTKDEVGVLASTFNKMAEDLAASVEAKLYKERVQKELEIAAQIQKELLPEDKLQWADMDVAGGLVPATEVGGDAFDYIEMQDGRHMIYLGDVTGHGVPAGIVSSVTNAVLFGLRGETDLRSVFKKLNDVIQEKTSMKVFVTMALTLWDSAKSTLFYANAGHPPLLYYTAKERKVMDVKLQGMALGMIDQAEDKIQVQQIPMAANDVVVLYSDGVPEALNAHNEQYGMQRLKRIVQDAANDLYTAEGIKNAVLADVLQHIGEREHTDDITVVVLKKKV